MNVRPIQIWVAKDAPKEILDHIPNQDDMDYVALVPPENSATAMLLLDNERFGCCTVQIIQHGKWEIYVGYHA